MCEKHDVESGTACQKRKPKPIKRPSSRQNFNAWPLQDWLRGIHTVDEKLRGCCPARDRSRRLLI